MLHEGTGTSAFMLRFIDGCYEGGAPPLREGRAYVLGSERGVELVLSEDRQIAGRHAMICCFGGEVTIRALEGEVLVNGGRVETARLQLGETFQVGQSVVRLDPGEYILDDVEVTHQRRSSDEPVPLEEAPLPDLLQFLNTMRRSAVVQIRAPEGEAQIFMRQGQVYHVTLRAAAEAPAPPQLSVRETLFYVLFWTSGHFLLLPPPTEPVPASISEPTEDLLLEFCRREIAREEGPPSQG